MSTKLTKAYTQYSKKMTTALLVFWGVIRLASVILVAINPDCGTSLVNIVRGTDDITMVVVCSYTANSIGEKGISGYFNYKAKEKIEEDEEIEESSSNG